MEGPGRQRETANPSRGIPCLELPEWRARFGLVAGITTRGDAGDFSLGLWSGSAPVADVMRRWAEFRGAFTPGCTAVVVSRQCHGTRVRWHERAGEGWLLLDGYDGHLTAATGLLLGVSVADCVPVYLVARQGAVVGLLHAGWRGIAAGVLEAGLERFSTAAAISPSDVIMHCGVSICGDCYEVGPEVILNVTGRRVGAAERLDLRGELVRRARERGVAEVTISPYCTRHDTGWFHSHRGSGGQAGRMIAYLGRPQV